MKSLLYAPLSSASSAQVLRAYGSASALCLGAALLAAALQAWLDPASQVLVFMLAVVLSAAAHGRGPALWAAALAVLLFNLLVVPPRLSLSVADPRFFFTFAIMLIVGLVVGQLTAGLRAQAGAAARREQQVRRLYGFSRELGAALSAGQAAEHLQRFAG
jgi:two-component system sensor histidine kinase KdpD